MKKTVGKLPTTLTQFDYWALKAISTSEHYQLVSMGWEKDLFSYAVIYHLDLKPDGKIWIQANNTDRDIAEALEQMGVPKSDIVIGSQPPRFRPYTGYAVA